MFNFHRKGKSIKEMKLIKNMLQKYAKNKHQEFKQMD